MIEKCITDVLTQNKADEKFEKGSMLQDALVQSEFSLMVICRV